MAARTEAEITAICERYSRAYKAANPNNVEPWVTYKDGWWCISEKHDAGLRERGEHRYRLGRFETMTKNLEEYVEQARLARLSGWDGLPPNASEGGAFYFERLKDGAVKVVLWVHAGISFGPFRNPEGCWLGEWFPEGLHHSRAIGEYRLIGRVADHPDTKED